MPTTRGNREKEKGQNGTIKGKKPFGTPAGL